jgi:hypothetical protein
MGDNMTSGHDVAKALAEIAAAFPESVSGGQLEPSEVYELADDLPLLSAEDFKQHLGWAMREILRSLGDDDAVVDAIASILDSQLSLARPGEVPDRDDTYWQEVERMQKAHATARLRYMGHDQVRAILSFLRWVEPYIHWWHREDYEFICSFWTSRLTQGSE